MGACRSWKIYTSSSVPCENTQKKKRLRSARARSGLFEASPRQGRGLRGYCCLDKLLVSPQMHPRGLRPFAVPVGVDPDGPEDLISLPKHAICLVLGLALVLPARALSADEPA